MIIIGLHASQLCFHGSSSPLPFQIAFWLIEKNFRVLIAACDTFRSGAVEQLRTHVHKLNYIHPPEQHGGQKMVELYEQGYGRDAASIARSAINYGELNVSCFIQYLMSSNHSATMTIWGVSLPVIFLKLNKLGAVSTCTVNMCCGQVVLGASLVPNSHESLFGAG